MTDHYRIQYSKKHKGWVPYRMSQSTFRYFRVPKSPVLETPEYVEIWLKAAHKSKHRYNSYVVYHVINGHTGSLIPLDEWKEQCDENCFIDYDGFGRPVDENYKFIDRDDFYDYMVWPSDYTERGGDKIPSNTKYIHWYNR